MQKHAFKERTVLTFFSFVFIIWSRFLFFLSKLFLCCRSNRNPIQNEALLQLWINKREAKHFAFYLLLYMINELLIKIAQYCAVETIQRCVLFSSHDSSHELNNL